jgi:hypothetical protein
LFENITLPGLTVILITTGVIILIFLLWVLIKLDSISKQIEKQRDNAELKASIVNELKKNKP